MAMPRLSLTRSCPGNSASRCGRSVTSSPSSSGVTEGAISRSSCTMGRVYRTDVGGLVGASAPLIEVLETVTHLFRGKRSLNPQDPPKLFANGQLLLRLGDDAAMVLARLHSLGMELREIADVKRVYDVA